MSKNTLVLVVLLFGFDVAARAADTRLGGIDGRLTAGGRGVAGAVVKVEEIGETTFSDDGGAFRFAALPSGRYTLTFSLGEYTAREAEVEVSAGATTAVAREVDWPLSFAETLTVISASRRRERILDAPAAVTIVGSAEIEQRAASGQLPKLLEFTPGVEPTQSGLYDFNLNVRGFNASINRRILVLIDGRDPSLPFLGSQEWAAISFPLYDLERLELVRGPASALYGTDAFNGVLNMTTKPPGQYQGGEARLSGGELATRRIDFRHAGVLGQANHYKLVGGYVESDDFSRSRVGTAEYEGVPTEAVPLDPGGDEIAFGAARVDRSLVGDVSLTLEGGTAHIQGPLGLTNVGRAQPIDDRRPWARFSLDARRWNVFGSHTARDGREFLTLSTGQRTALDTHRNQLEAQGNMDFADGAARLVGGVSYQETSIDSADASGAQTLLFEKQESDRWGTFAQLDYDVSDRLKLVAAARYDEGSLFDARLSPKGAVVWAARPEHTFRLTYNEAFQSPNIAEFFVDIPVAAPLDLSAVEGALAPFLDGVPLGFGSIPFLALGNVDLEVEEVATVELGYSGVLGRNVFLTVDLYRSEIENFVSTLLPQLGTSLGRINPNFGPYAPPAALTPGARELVLETLAAVLPPETFALLSNNVDGSPIFAAFSFANAGRVETQGVEIALQALLGRWSLEGSWSYLDFEIREQAAESPILPNAPDQQLSLGVAYHGDRFDADLRWRYVDDFTWQGGIYIGPVPSYSVVDLTAAVPISTEWTLGLEVANLLDNEHYEIFGGDLLGRRALAYASYRW